MKAIRKLFDGVNSGKIKPADAEIRKDVIGTLTKIELRHELGRLIMRHTTTSMGESFEYFYTTDAIKNHWHG